MITYNHERYLAQALESVLVQRVNFDYEIVVGEDCSTDRTREILMDFHRRNPDKIVPLLRERNLGAMRNFMETLAACRGQYVALLEGDDYWISEDKLQRQVDFLDAHPDYGICCGRAQVLNDTGRYLTGTFPQRPAGTYTIEDLLKENIIMTCTSVCRRELIGELPSWLNDMKLGDWPLHAIVARKGRIQLMDGTTAMYRVHAGGMWSSMPSIGQYRETVRMMRALDRHLDFQHTKLIRGTIAGFYCGMAMAAQQERRRVATGKYLAISLWNGSWRRRDWWRMLAFFAVYAIMGSWYKVFSRSKQK